MKKLTSAFAMVLAVLMVLSMTAASAEESAAPGASEPADPVVGSWRLPASPYGDDFTCYVVLNADGSFLNATNLYLSGDSGPYTQTVVTNETFTWVRTGPTELELHYSYLDDNGEFVTTLTYDAARDALCWCNELYATRDDSFVLSEPLSVQAEG